MTKETKILIGLGLLTGLLFIGAIFFLSRDKTVATGKAVDNEVLIGQAGHSISYPEAKVTITEFADFQCPACARTNPVLKQLLSEYQGRVNFVYRHFPLPQHTNAIAAIKAAEAAGQQGKFWEMAELLYSKQASWSDLDDPKPVFISLAKELNLDEVKYALDFESSSYQDVIQKDLQDAISLSVNGTPTLYINGVKVAVSPSYQNLKNLIEQEIKKSN